jgi:hypothetical protein
VVERIEQLRRNHEVRVAHDRRPLRDADVVLLEHRSLMTSAWMPQWPDPPALAVDSSSMQSGLSGAK